MAASLQELLHSAYSAVRADETNKSLSPITIDHLIQERIDAIQGGDSRLLLSSDGTSLNSNRISKLAVLDNIDAAVDAIVSAVKAAGDDPAKLRKLGLSVAGERT